MANSLGPNVGNKLPITEAVVKVLPPITVQSGASSTGNAALWTGEGIPTLVLGSSVGDEYLDTLTGTLYRLEPGM